MRKVLLIALSILLDILNPIYGCAVGWFSVKVYSSNHFADIEKAALITLAMLWAVCGFIGMRLLSDKAFKAACK